MSMKHNNSYDNQKRLKNYHVFQLDTLEHPF